MDKYIIIALVLICVLLAAYAVGLRRQLTAANQKCTTLSAQKQYLQIKNNQDEMIYGVKDMKYHDQLKTITSLKTQLRIAETKLARLRNRIKNK